SSARDLPAGGPKRRSLVDTWPSRQRILMSRGTVGSSEEVTAELLPQARGELEAFRVDALVVAVEHLWIFGVRDACRMEAEPVRRPSGEAKEPRIRPAGGDARDDPAAGHQFRGGARERIDQRRVER